MQQHHTTAHSMRCHTQLTHHTNSLFILLASLLLLLSVGMSRISSTSAVCFSTSAVPAARDTTCATLQSATTPPQGWTDEGPAVRAQPPVTDGPSSSPPPCAEVQMDFKLYLKQNTEQLQQVLDEVADPVRRAHTDACNTCARYTAYGLAR